MIRYTLRCPEAHEFEVWFASSAAYDDQRDKGHVTCALCGSADIEKAMMTPSVATARKKEAKSEMVRLAANHAMQKEALEVMRKVRDHVTKNAENVGRKFPEEARKIHYQEVEPRGIYGEATGEEAKALKDEGVEFHPLPVLPEDQN